LHMNEGSLSHCSSLPSAVAAVKKLVCVVLHHPSMVNTFFLHGVEQH
jgi:ABC-type ATPase involved in cell division